MSRAQGWYRKLDVSTTEIRLVTIEPGEGGTPISCTMQTVRLTKESNYEALSYVWGDPKSGGKITLNNKDFRVLGNLKIALRHLRGRQPRTLWIDAICINQEDLDERASQVRLMKDIYQRAQNTVIWIGDETAESRRALAWVRCMPVTGCPPGMYMNANNPALIQNMRELQQSTKGQLRALEDLNFLCDDIALRPYWARVWVVQEAIVSPRSVIKCGHSEVSLAHLTEVIFMVVASHFMPDLAIDFPISLMPLQRIMEFTNTRLLIQDKVPIPMSHLVSWFRDSIATDARDMAYGLVGIAANGKDDLLDPNYAKTNTKEDVYRNVVEHSFKSDGNLDLITMARGSLDPKWPSWVPDWAAPVARRGMKPEEYDFADHYTLKIPPLVLGFVESSRLFSHHVTKLHKMYKTAAEDGEYQPSIFAASGSFPPKYTILRSPSRLVVEGISVDPIKAVSTIFPYWSADWLYVTLWQWEKLVVENIAGWRPANPAQKERSFEQVSNRCFQVFHDGEKPSTENFMDAKYKSLERMQRTWQSFSRKRHSPIGDAPYISGGSVSKAYLQTLVTGMKETERLTEEEYDSFWQGNSRQELVASLPFLNRIRSITKTRIFAVSDAGYIGVVPPNTQPGDKICVLFGCSVPVVIRKVENHHVFIGECYVHGIMDGEAVTKFESGRTTSITFTLH
ncbi:hypothetical protein BP5796_05043 [Coleophoma crateriformis]|uniref:Heterokaryon incompatibility domain-containing protein n=1 Tax=Coleophoma crateriformis TaxID=565419 RepID=A0A3D8S241_9HELO|nr:hypothetical protein BP5796_05043 [Coleophoma crateriformis]